MSYCKYHLWKIAITEMWDFFVDVIDDVSGGVGDLFKAAGDLTGVIQGGGKGEFIGKQSG